MNEAEVKAAVEKTTAPRVTEDGIKDRIKSVRYFIFPETTLTIALIEMVNGFTFTGESACASPENFDRKIGEHYAFADAFKKIWSHEAYLLKERLSVEPEIEAAARAAHEAIRTLQIENNEPNVASPWETVGQDIKDSCFIGIERVINDPNITSEQLHDSWLQTKESQGWKYGEVRSETDKLHPCMVPYQELPAFQRLKDAMFRNVVKAVLDL